MGVADIAGTVGSLLSFVLWLPQAVTVWRHRREPQNLRAVSLTTQALVVVNALTWGVYAAVTGAYWSGAPGVINAPLAVLTICLVLRARRTEGEPRRAGGSGVATQGPAVP